MMASKDLCLSNECRSVSFGINPGLAAQPDQPARKGKGRQDCRSLSFAFS
jgi:hypothetical protein